MSVMLTPPLASKSIVDQIYTFEPATYGDADLIDASRLRRLLADPGNLLYVWDRDKFSLEPLFLKNETAEQPPAEQILFPAAGSKSNLTLAPGAVALSPDINRPAIDIDAIRVELTEASKDKIADENSTLQLSYPSGTITLPLAKTIKTATDGAFLFQLSEHKNWLKQGVVKKLSLEANGISQPIEIKKISALRIASAQPLLQADARDLLEGPDGICRVRGARPSFSYDVSGVAGAVGAVCEVSKPDSWFEHYSGTLRDTSPSANALHVVPFNRTRGRNILLSFAGLKDHGFYQIKIAAVDKDGKVLGYFSDPLNFQI
jgi:hypothetical protein